MRSERRNVLEGDALYLAVLALRFDANQAGGGFQDELGNGLLHGQHAHFEQHCYN
ncbi:hypothetical protein D3C76_1856460 [compost metagenome]